MTGELDALGDEVDLEGGPESDADERLHLGASGLGARCVDLHRGSDLEGHPVADVEGGGLAEQPLRLRDRAGPVDVEVNGVPHRDPAGQQGGGPLDHPPAVDPIEPLDELVVGVLALQVCQRPGAVGRLDLQLVSHRPTRRLG